MEHGNLEIDKGCNHEDGGGGEEAQIFHHEEVGDGQYKRQDELQRLKTGEDLVNTALHAELPGGQDHLDQIQRGQTEKQRDSEKRVGFAAVAERRAVGVKEGTDGVHEDHNADVCLFHFQGISLLSEKSLEIGKKGQCELTKLYPLSRTFLNLSTLIFRRDFSGVSHLTDLLFLQIQQSGQIGYRYP